MFCGFQCSDFTHILYKPLKYFMFYDFSVNHGLNIQLQKVHFSHKIYFYSLSLNITISINPLANNRILKNAQDFQQGHMDWRILQYSF